MFIRKIIKICKNMEQLLPNEFKRDVEFMEVIICTVKSNLIDGLFQDFKTLEQVFFNEKLSHLKRINKSQLSAEKLEKDQSFALICLKEVKLRFYFYMFSKKLGFRKYS